MRAHFPVSPRLTLLLAGLIFITPTQVCAGYKSTATNSTQSTTTSSTVGTLTVDDVQVDESAGTAQVVIRLLKAVSKPVTVGYATKPGTAQPGYDYIGLSGKLQFASGQTRQVVSVKILDDSLVEGDEYFLFRIYNPRNANILNDVATATIHDNDGQAPDTPPTVELQSPNDNTTYPVNTDIQLSVNATDADGTVARVEYYSDGVKLGADTTSPHVYTWRGAALGTHYVTALAVDNNGLTAESATHRVDVVDDTSTASGSLVVYPATQDIQTRFQSGRFAVDLTQNGVTRSSFVYESDNTSDPGWAGTLDYMQTANHWTTFSFDGSVEVAARRLDGQTIRSCVVRPLALNVQTNLDGDTCRFTLDQPANVSVEIDENASLTANVANTGLITKQIVKHPLFVFADPLETSVPSPGDAGVLYFGPGIHQIGKEYPLANNTQVYIAGGAYVIGTFKAPQSNPQNIAIRGRGILSAIGLTETATESTTWANHSIDFSVGRSGANLLIEGITITDPLRTCIVSYNPVVIRHVKLMSWNHRNDGITAGNGSLIEDSFIKVEDDNIKLYYSNQTVRRNVIWQQTAGAVFKFAWSLSGTSQGNIVSDIDLIHSDVFTDYCSSETDRPDMHSSNAVFSAMGFNKNAAFKNAVFQNIRIEEKNLLRLMGLRMVSSQTTQSGTTNWGDPDPSAPKLIDNLTLSNVQLAGLPYKPITLYGNDGGVISNILFAGLSVNGVIINARSALGSRLDGAGLATAGTVSGITFSP